MPSMSTFPAPWWATLWLLPPVGRDAAGRRCRWCSQGQVACPSCHGTSSDCYRCSGKGHIVCMVCGGATAV